MINSTPLNVLNNNLVYIACFVIVAIIGLYFLICWLIRNTVRDELKQMAEHKNKKKKALQIKQRKMLEIQQEHQRRQQRQHEQDRQQDMDSYIDPAEGYNGNKQQSNDNDESDQLQGGYSGDRLAKDDIMMRDIADGTR